MKRFHFRDLTSRSLVHCICVSRLLPATLLAAAGVSMNGAEAFAPPNPFGVQVREPERLEFATASSIGLHSATGGTRYSIGEPTDEEQLYLEMLNRARRDPTAEGVMFRETQDANLLGAYRFFSVDLDLMASQFEAIAPAPPLSFHAALIEAARGHSRDMLENEFQGHTGTDGGNTGTRVTSQGYPWIRLGENVFSSARSVLHGHAGFQVDWGGTPETGGMQDPPGHRITIHNPAFREVGVGVVLGVNGSSGPQVVTQDFASRQAAPALITGVVYYDLNDNQFYDLGEGLGGATVTVPGSSFFAVSSVSGAYTVPVPQDGAYTVSFSVPGLQPVTAPVNVSGGQNVKVDHLPPYNPPSLSGPSAAQPNRTVSLAFSKVGGAIGYDWRAGVSEPYLRIEGAEAGLSGVTADTGDYEVVDSRAKASGTASFHLAHLTSARQSLTLNPKLLPKAGAMMLFKSRLGIATENQIAKLEVSLDAGQSWTEIWTQRGAEGQRETTFQDRAVSLGSYLNREIAVRFAYEVDGRFFVGSEAHLGLHLDDIRFTAVDEVLSETVQDAGTGATVQFRPDRAGNYALQVRAKLPGRQLPWGPVHEIVVSEGGAEPGEVRITSLAAEDGGYAIAFAAPSATGANIQVEAADEAFGPWQTEAGVVVELVNAGVYRARVPGTAAPRRFYRIAIR